MLNTSKSDCIYRSPINIEPNRISVRLQFNQKKVSLYLTIYVSDIKIAKFVCIRFRTFSEGTTFLVLFLGWGLLDFFCGKIRNGIYIYNTSIAHWNKNPLRRTSEHIIINAIIWISHFSLEKNLFLLTSNPFWIKLIECW